MEHAKNSPSEPITLGLKRKTPEFGSSRTFKMARTNVEHGTLVGSSSCCHRGSYCSSKQSALAKNHLNFLRSKTPRRIMFYSAGEWSDFPEPVTILLVKAFMDKRSAVEVCISDTSYLFDFLSMVLINLENGGRRSISWIDESNKCFFPSIFLSEGCYPIGSRNYQSSTNVDVKVQGSVTSDAGCKDQIKTGGLLLKAPGGNDRIENRPPIPIKEGGSDSHEVAVVKTQVTEETTLENRSPPISVKQGGSGCQKAAVVKTEVIEETMLENNSSPIIEKQATAMRTLCCELVQLDKDSKDFILVMRMFLLGLPNFADHTSIVGIYRYTCMLSSALTRQENFERQIVTTRHCRGDANVRYGWFGTSKKGLVQILLHGFGRGTKVSEGAAYGTGVYLMPENCSFASVKYCDDDENGTQYMVLCQVIMGNMEKVPAGSKQISPSNPEFDSGVDDLLQPNCYVVWGAHTATHIHPEFIISFRLSPTVRECLAGLTDIKGDSSVMTGNGKNVTINYPASGPSSAWISFTSLFAEIKDKVSPLAMELLNLHHREFQNKMVTCDEFVNKMRLIVGDPVLISTLKMFQQKPSAYPNEQPVDGDIGDKG